MTNRRRTIAVDAGPTQKTPDQHINIVNTDKHKQEPSTNTTNIRKSSRPKKETKRYGDTTNLDFLYSSDDKEPPHKRHASSVASYSQPKASMIDIAASPERSTIPVTSASHNNNWRKHRRTKLTSPTPVKTRQDKTTKTTSVPPASRPLIPQHVLRQKQQIQKLCMSES